jgi:hypothetical protein
VSDFRKRIQAAINGCSKENGSNTPDWILAEYLDNCLRAFDVATAAREDWYGMHLRPGGDPGPDSPPKGQP